MRERERGSSIICVCLRVYSGNSESGTFFWVSFPVFMESSEEQHFLRGKPAFQAQTLFQAPRTGSALSSIYVFTQCHINTSVEKLVCLHVYGCVSDNTHTHTQQRQAVKQANLGQMSQNISEGSDSPALPVFTRCNRPF